MTENSPEYKQNEAILSDKERISQNQEAFTYLQYLLDGHKSRLISRDLPRTILTKKDDGRVIELKAQYLGHLKTRSGIDVIKFRVSENGLESVSVKGKIRFWPSFSRPIEINNTVGENGDLSEAELICQDPLRPMTASMEIVNSLKSRFGFYGELAKRMGLEPTKGSVAELVQKI